MGKKALIGTLCAVATLGVVGGVCYNEIPSFKTTINKVFTSNNKANIGIPDKNTSNNGDTLKPITPDEFLKTYKFELPVSFLGGDLYVKKLANNNLLVSSSVGKGILFCNAITEKVTFFELDVANWTLFHETSNGNCYISSTNSKNLGLLYFNIQDVSMTKIFETGYNYSCFAELGNNEALISSSTSSSLLHHKVDGTVVNYTLKITSIFALPDDNCLMYQTSVGYGKFDTKTGTFTAIENAPANIPTGGVQIDCGNGNGLIYSISNTSSTPGVYAYVYETNSFTELYSSGYYFDQKVKLSNGKYILSSYVHGYFTGCLLLDCNSLTATLVSNVSAKYSVMAEYEDCCLLFSSQGGYPKVVYSLTFEDNQCTELLSSSNGINMHDLKDGSLLFYIPRSGTSSSNVAGFWIFDATTKTISNPCTTGYDFTIIEELDDGSLLLAGTTDGNKGYKGLYYFNKEALTTNCLLYNNEVTSIEKQADGTYYITTVDEFDYEFNPETETIKLVYTVEVEN